MWLAQLPQVFFEFAHGSSEMDLALDLELQTHLPLTLQDPEFLLLLRAQKFLYHDCTPPLFASPVRICDLDGYFTLVLILDCDYTALARSSREDLRTFSSHRE